MQMKKKNHNYRLYQQLKKEMLFNPSEKKKIISLYAKVHGLFFLQVSQKKIYTTLLVHVFPSKHFFQDLVTFIIWMKNRFRLVYPPFFLQMCTLRLHQYW